MCRDPQVTWYPQRTVDYAAMNAAWANWKYDEAHKELKYHDGTFRRWSNTRSEAYPFGYKDGVTVTVSTEDLTPDDDFLTPPDERDDYNDDDFFPEDGDDGDKA